MALLLPQVSSPHGMAWPLLLGTVGNKLSFLWQSLPAILVLSYPRFSMNTLYLKALVKFEPKFGCQSRNSSQERRQSCPELPWQGAEKGVHTQNIHTAHQATAAMLLSHSLHCTHTPASGLLQHVFLSGPWLTLAPK